MSDNQNTGNELKLQTEQSEGKLTVKAEFQTPTDNTGENNPMEKSENELEFQYERPVIKLDGTVDSEKCTIKAPLLSLVPLPAFDMDELTVDFNMEVKHMEMSEDKTHKDASATVNYNSWFGLDVTITGSVSSAHELKIK